MFFLFNFLSIHVQATNLSIAHNKHSLCIYKKIFVFLPIDYSKNLALLL